MADETYLEVLPENIPQELKDLKQWTAWEPVPVKGKKADKVPYSLQLDEDTGEITVKPASVNKPDSWMTFEDALKLLESNTRFKGLQFVLPSKEVAGDSPRITGIDLDDVKLENGNPNSVMLEVVASLPKTYAELSPSGKGIRAFGFASFSENEGVHSGDIEVYQYGKLLTVTGHILDDAPDTVESIQEDLDTFRAKYFKPYSEIESSELPLTSLKFTDEDLISKIEGSKSSNKFKDLFYIGAFESDDHSVKDFDLCRLLVFWTQDKDQIDRIFRRSKLYRPKWDEMHGHDETGAITYGQMTVNKVLKTRKEVYKPKTDLSTFNVDIFPYVVNEEGIFQTIIPKGGGESYKIKISSTPCIITAIGRNIDTGEILYKLNIKDNLSHKRTVWRGTSGLMKRSEVTDLLGFGMHFQESNASCIIDYFDKFLIQYMHDLPTEVVASRCGWKNDFSIFIIGNSSISEDGVIEVLQVDNTASSFYKQKGNVKEFAKYANKLLKYPAVRFKAYCGCAAVLLKILYIPSSVVDQNCLTGRLKSVSNWLVAAMFGDPIKLQLDSGSTQIGITKVIEYCTDLPTFVDETSKAPENIKNLIYTVANGNSRATSNSNQGLDISANFSTVLLITGENPLLTETAKGGEEARVILLKEGVEERIPTPEVEDIEIAIKNNYGHIAPMFLQELFKEKDSIMDVYRAYFEALPDVEDITSSRVKKYYACIATAGYLLEKVFAQIGIDPADPREICTRYFEKNVTNTTIEPDYIKILRIAYSWYTANEAHFENLEERNDRKELLERYGWIKTVKGEETINFVPETLKKQVINVVGRDGAIRYESALNAWKNSEIINVRKIKDPDTQKLKILRTCQIRNKDGKFVTVIQIPLRNFYEHLGLEDSDQQLEDPENSARSKTKTPPKTGSSIFEPRDDSEFAALLQEGL